MPYVTRQQIVAKIPAVFLTEALDDDGDGAEDAGLFDQIVANESQNIEALLSGRFQTPFADPAPPAICQAAQVFVLYAIYKRRTTGDKNPWSSDYNYWTERLKGIGESGKGLDVGAEGQPASSAASGSNPVVPSRITGVSWANTPPINE